MTAWSIAAALGFALVAGFLFVRHDLRGWTPEEYNNPATRVEATLPGVQGFVVADCVPGTVDPYGGPTPAEYTGTATVTVLSCRSKSSAVASLLVYFLVAGVALVIQRAIRPGRAQDGAKPIRLR